MNPRIDMSDVITAAGHGPKILVTDDDARFRTVLSLALQSKGFDVVEAENGEDAMAKIGAGSFAVVLLDLNMPGMGGLAACQAIRGLSPSLQIIVLSVRDGEDEKVGAFNAGADDYVTKPFSVSELLARVKSAIRRATGIEPKMDKTIVIGEIRLDPERRTVFKSQTQLHLTPKEFNLLHYMMANAGTPITHQKLLAAVCGPGHGHQHEYLRTFIKQLRKKLEDNPGAPQYVLREPGVGYRFRVF